MYNLWITITAIGATGVIRDLSLLLALKDSRFAHIPLSQSALDECVTTHYSYV